MRARSFVQHRPITRGSPGLDTEIGSAQATGIVKRGFKSLPWPWAVFWGVWSVLTLVFVTLRILPALAEFTDLVDQYPEMMLEWRGVLALASLLGWVVLGVIALVFLQAFFRRAAEASGHRS